MAARNRNTPPKSTSTPEQTPSQSPEEQRALQPYDLGMAIADRIYQGYGESFEEYRQNTIRKRIPRYDSLSSKEKVGKQQAQEEGFNKRLASLMQVQMPDGNRFKTNDIFSIAHFAAAQIGEPISSLKEADRIVPGIYEVTDVVVTALDEDRAMTKNEKIGVDAVRMRAMAEAVDTISPIKGGVSLDDYGNINDYKTAQMRAISQYQAELLIKADAARRHGNPGRAAGYLAESNLLGRYSDIYITGAEPENNQHNAAQEYLKEVKAQDSKRNDSNQRAQQPRTSYVDAMLRQKEQDTIRATYGARYNEAIQQRMRAQLDRRDETDLKQLIEGRSAGAGHSGLRSLEKLTDAVGKAYGAKAGGMSIIGNSDIRRGDRVAFDMRLQGIVSREIEVARRKARDEGKEFSVDTFIQDRTNHYLAPLSGKISERNKESIRSKIVNSRIAKALTGRDKEGKEFKGWKKVVAGMGIVAVGATIIAATGGAATPLVLASVAGGRYWVKREAAALSLATSGSAGQAKAEDVKAAIEKADTDLSKIQAVTGADRKAREKFVDEQRWIRTKTLGGVALRAGAGIIAPHVASYAMSQASHFMSHDVLNYIRGVGGSHANQAVNNAMGTHQLGPIHSPGNVHWVTGQNAYIGPA